MNEVKKFNFRIHRGFSESISATFDFVKLNYKMIWKILVRIPGPILLVSILILMFSFIGSYNNLIQAQQSQGQNLTDVLPYNFGLMSFGIVLFMLASVLFTISINEFIVLYVNNENPEDITIKEVFQNVKERFWLYIGGGLLVGLMVMSGMIFLLIPGIYLAVVTMYVFIIISAEGKGISDAISRSFKVISGFWWSSFGYIIVIGFLVMSITYIIQIPTIGISTYFLISDTESSIGAIIYGITNGFSYIIYMAISSLTIIAISVYYYSIVEAKEQIGLKHKIEEMDASTEEAIN